MFNDYTLFKLAKSHVSDLLVGSQWRGQRRPTGKRQRRGTDPGKSLEVRPTTAGGAR